MVDPEDIVATKKQKNFHTQLYGLLIARSPKDIL